MWKKACLGLGLLAAVGLTGGSALGQMDHAQCLPGNPNSQEMVPGSCDPFHLGACQDQASCEAAGGHWFAESCHRYAEEECQSCMVQAQARHYRPGEPIMNGQTPRQRVRAERTVVGCQLMVPPEDQGKVAMVGMFAYCPDHPEWGWMDLSPRLQKKEVCLGENLDLSLDVDLKPFRGSRFQVCCGYLTEDQKIGYHCFEVDVEE